MGSQSGTRGFRTLCVVESLVETCFVVSEAGLV